MRAKLTLGAIVAILSAHAADAQLSARQLQAVEELRIDGTSYAFLFPFGFLHAKPNGDMAFANWTTFQVLFFDRSGKNFAKFGARGDGPGEFRAVSSRGGQRANFSGGLVGDTIWTYDASNRRLTFISGQGRLIRSVRAPELPRTHVGMRVPGLVGATPLAVHADGGILARSIAPRSPPSQEFDEYLVVIAPDARSYRVLASLPKHSGKEIAITDPATGRQYRFAVPFTPRATHAVAPHGQRVVVVTPELTSTSSGKMTLRAIDMHGDTLFRREHPLTGQVLTSARVNAYFGTLERDLRAQNAGSGPAFPPKVADAALAQLRKNVPRISLAIGQVRAGTDNSIWIALPRDSTYAWYVFDEHGAPLGYVVPKRSHMLQAATRSMMWVMEYDDDGIPQIVRYRIQ